jgi:hypothetical protein
LQSAFIRWLVFLPPTAFSSGERLPDFINPIAKELDSCSIQGNSKAETAISARIVPTALNELPTTRFFRYFFSVFRRHHTTSLWISPVVPSF